MVTEEKESDSPERCTTRGRGHKLQQRKFQLDADLEDASPTLLPLSLFFLLLSMMGYGIEYPFGLLKSAVPAVPAPNFLPTPSLLAGERAKWRKKK